MKHYSSEKEEVLRELGSSQTTGLTAEEAQRRLLENGKNKLAAAKNGKAYPTHHHSIGHSRLEHTLHKGGHQAVEGVIVILRCEDAKVVGKGNESFLPALTHIKTDIVNKLIALHVGCRHIGKSLTVIRKRLPLGWPDAVEITVKAVDVRLVYCDILVNDIAEILHNLAGKINEDINAVGIRPAAHILKPEGI